MAVLDKIFTLTLILWLAANPAFFITPALAEPATYELLEEQSHLTFTATQNDAPIDGEFDRFDVDIIFDKNDLPHSHIEARIDTRSLVMADTEIIAMLKLPEWFDSALFPQATYISKTIEKTDTPNRYNSVGVLTIKEHTHPVTLYFTLDIEENTTKANGYALIERNQFEVGEGEWASTSSIKNAVRVEFHLVTRQSSL